MNWSPLEWSPQSFEGSAKVGQGVSTGDSSSKQLNNNNNTSNFANLYDNEDRLNDCSHNRFAIPHLSRSFVLYYDADDDSYGESHN